MGVYFLKKEKPAGNVTFNGETTCFSPKIRKRKGRNKIVLFADNIEFKKNPKECTEKLECS